MKALQNSLYIYGRGGEDHTLFEIRTLELGNICITYLVIMFIYMCKAAINMHLFIYLFILFYFAQFLLKAKTTLYKSTCGVISLVLCSLKTACISGHGNACSHRLGVSERKSAHYRDCLTRWKLTSDQLTMLFFDWKAFASKCVTLVFFKLSVFILPAKHERLCNVVEDERYLVSGVIVKSSSASLQMAKLANL
jgi:hypothetical protein